ncbi:MAG: hypothetical protein LUC22_03035 [Prevotella sp.]|nr:hypothetical protein [Prevotella sp.]
MAKTVRQALLDEIYHPINVGLVDNKLIARGLDGDAEYTYDTARSDAWKGALADCLYSLIQAVSLSEADKSVGSLTDEDKKRILKLVNRLYDEIGEDEVDDGIPRVTIIRH